MKIAVDGGGLCTGGDRRYGNYVFTREFLTALSKKKLRHEFKIYSFCPNSSPVKNIFNNSGFVYRELLPKKLWMSLRVSLEEIKEKNDIFLSLNQALPLFTRAKKITFSHGLAFHYFPQFYPDDYNSLSRYLKLAVKKTDLMVVSSLRVKKELESVFPGFNKIAVIPFGIPSDYLKAPKQPDRLNKDWGSNPYLLYVGMDHPYKNIEFLIRSFLELTNRPALKEYRLKMIGVSKKYEALSEKISVIPHLESRDLAAVYRNASALLTVSHYESFNFPVLEALSQGCQVVGLRPAIIPEFDDYVNIVDDPANFTGTIAQVIRTGGKKIDQNRLREIFSWESYIDKLFKLINNLIE